MAHHTEKDGFPPLPLTPGMRIRLRALNPTTDAERTGVTVSEWSIYGRDESDDEPLALELPTWVPEEQGEGVV